MEYREYNTFETTAKDGSTIELAIVDEFEFEKKSYVVAALIEGDQISEDMRFIYRCIMNGEEASFEKIRNAIDYQKIAEAYMEMED